MRQENLGFHYAERLKSNFMLLARGLDRLSQLKGEELKGGKEVLKGVFDGLRIELNIARGFVPAEELGSAEMKVIEAEGNVELGDYEKARMNLAEGISQATTLAAKYIDVLKEKGLI